ncbi:hypothetical protein QFX18_12410 [Saccharophagus degradans]|uniref:hypothetical protein n=1 Tax=Saccharophagus degradans TaxID=86304 RepID=UPI002477F241|nr:hypothetical protein [Saccharophagus degradans]WGO96850.1 hypothetical protein QFX18_12410 [Saccharophagus degradans]
MTTTTKITPKNTWMIKSQFKALGGSFDDKGAPSGFESEVWKLDEVTCHIRIQNSIASKNIYCIANGIEPVNLCKVLTIDNINSNKGVNDYFFALKDMIILLIYYMVDVKKRELELSDIQPFLEYYLMTGIDNSGITHQRVSPRSSGSRPLILHLSGINHSLKYYGLPPILPRGLKTARIEKYLEKAIEITSAGELTYSDWIAGGTFNNLPLDYGQYYIEYLDNFFKDNYEIACALSEMINCRDDIISESGLNPNKNTIQIFYGLLSGRNVINDPKYKKYNDYSIKNLKETINERYATLTKSSLKRKHLLSAQSAKSIAKDIGIDLEKKNAKAELDRLKVILFCYVFENNFKKVEELLKESHFDTTIDDFHTAIEKLNTTKVKNTLPTKEYYEEIGIINGPNLVPKPDALTLVNKVASAGLTVITALTGWRGSEYGFGLNSVISFKNTDIIDQYSHPFRYKVNWRVFKTHGDRLQQREITQGVYEYIIRISKINSTQDGYPALYKTRSSTNDPCGKNSSYSAVSHAVKFNWATFLDHFKPFTMRREIDRNNYLKDKINEGCNLTQNESKELETLSTKINTQAYKEVENDHQLKIALDRFDAERGRVQFILMRSSFTAKKNWLLNYRQHLRAPNLVRNERGNDNQNIHHLLDKYLPEQTKALILSQSDSTLKNKVFAAQCSTSVVDDCLYPTPHAFRHIWAEAVFRRFDGDVGWMIRSNFKHISKSMWLAYIRNKDNARILEGMKTRVSSALLKNWLLKQGADTTGKFDRFLKRVFKNTAINNLSSIDEAIRKFTLNEVDSIKANPWGYCINMKGTSSIARCANNEGANPHNASPELCLGCVNFLMNSSNIDYVVFHSWQHINLVESAFDAEIPPSLVTPSIEYLKQARKRISELNSTHPIIHRYDETITQYQGP